MSRNLSAASIPQNLDAIDEALSRFEALRRGQTQHPEDQSVVVRFVYRCEVLKAPLVGGGR
jgi:hypothetical protein